MAPAAHDKTEQASKKSAVEPTSDVDDDDDDEDDVSARAIFPLIFARLPIREPIPASPRLLNPARFVRASRGAANSALLAAFIAVECSICYFVELRTQGNSTALRPPRPPRSLTRAPSVHPSRQPKVSKTKKTCSSIYRGVRQRPWGRYAPRPGSGHTNPSPLFPHRVSAVAKK